MQTGFMALAERYGLRLVQPLKVQSLIGTTRMRQETDEKITNTYPASYQPADSFAGHFEFGLKYEDIHLEFFARLFAACGPEPIARWCLQAPFGQYARRAGFFYEWLTGQSLEVPDVTNGGYVDALSPQDYLTRTQPQRVRRWRINNNLPGTAAFCPLVRRTPALQQATGFDLKQALAELDQTYGADILLRSANWLTLKESRASFLIEKEADQAGRIQRFAHVIAQHCGLIEEPLETSNLLKLQAGILGENAMSLGVRRSPVFIGQSTLREDIVHYIAPHFLVVSELLSGLRAFEQATRGAEPLIRAGAISFAFVYIHPMRDGNGRIHRFLINDCLIRDQLQPAGMILPLSATITNRMDFRLHYEQTLESFSKPFMRCYAQAYRFAKVAEYEDGARSNFIFDQYQEALFAWRYPDLTAHVVFTANLVAETVQTEMVEEARLMAMFQQAREQLKEIIEMPDQDANRIIRSLRENGWELSGKLKQQYPQLIASQKIEHIIEAVRSAFDAALNDPETNERQGV